MGSMISLGVGRMEIDWGKNNRFRDHSALFQPTDVKEIPYYYVDDDGTPITVYREGYSRELSSTKRRLDLLGYTLANVQKQYVQMAAECADYGFDIILSFDSFAGLLKEIDVSRISTPEHTVDYCENGYDLGEFVRRCIIPEEEIYSKLLSAVDGDKHHLNFGLETFFENMDPYIILRLLAENPSCKDLDVYWSFADVVEGGWVKREEIVHPLCDAHKILIVTEGSSDSFIIKKTIQALYPDISDFFRFIDMEDNYPFTGIGNLYNFCCGLMKIGVHNQMIVVFDNDAAGNEKYKKLMKLSQMKNLLITKLPESQLFEQVHTVGPQGNSVENINGTAVAIECFLDFSSYHEAPSVRWTTYMDKAGNYQGALMHKEEYVRAFKKANLLDSSYDTSKLTFLIDDLLMQWSTARYAGSNR